MNYKDAFAIDEISYEERERTQTKNNNQFLLNNYVNYDAKLMKEFYLKYFISKLLFEVHILELDDFLDYHFKYAENPNKFYKILKSIVVPQIEEIIENAMPNFTVNGTPAGKNLGDGFYENGSVIYKYAYEYSSMYESIGGVGFTSKYKERLSIIKDFLEIDKVKIEVEKIKWIAGPATLGFIIRELIDNEYIEGDKYSGEINASALAKKLLQVFNVKDCSSSGSLCKYLNSNDRKFQQVKQKFDKSNFKIPSANYL
jgi:hypothetical protein